MAKKLRTSDQPLVWRACVTLFQFFASLKLAVVLIFSAALTLAWATFVESEYGTPAVQFGIYGSRGFELLNILLAINIFCAAAIRFPWKKHQTGFVITHIGLLTLLFGGLLQRRGGIDAEMPVFEGDVGYRVFTDDHQFQLKIDPAGKHSAKGDQASPEKSQVVEIAFDPGPFNWSDYGTMFQPLAAAEIPGWSEKSLADRIGGYAVIGFKNFCRISSGLAFRGARRSQGTIYDRDGIKLEVLDYYADSEQIDAPLVKLQMSMPAREQMGADGRQVKAAPTWMPLELRIPTQTLPEFPFGLGMGQATGGGRVTFRVMGSATERDAFLKSGPQGDLGALGQVVLHYQGSTYPLSVAELKEQKTGERTAVGDSGLQVELVKQLPNGTLGSARRAGPDGLPGPLALIPSDDEESQDPAVELALFRDDKPVGRLILFARHAEYNIQDYKADLFGTYWYNFGELTAAQRMQGGAGKRFDIVQGPAAQKPVSDAPTEQLFYRNWDGEKLVASGPLPGDKEPVDSFKMPIAQLQLKVDRFVPSAKPAKVELPLAFNSKRALTEKRPAVQVRLTVDGESKEFWLAGIPAEPFERPALTGEVMELQSPERRVTLTFPPIDVFTDSGFQVLLKKFERKLDPGTSQAAHYGSVIDIQDRSTPGKDKNGGTVLSDVQISMNAPIDYFDPKSGRMYRLFQESFGGPWGPESPIYKQHADKSTGRDQVFMSVLTVNVDPGRGVRTAGIVLIVTGIFTMFYMRAYFFKPTPRKDGQRSNVEPAAAELVA